MDIFYRPQISVQPENEVGESGIVKHKTIQQVVLSQGFLTVLKVLLIFIGKN